MAFVFRLIWLALIVISVNFPMKVSALTKVKIELKWFHQFQFAGIYAAKEKGFYEAAGLDVDIIERDVKSTPLEDVLSNKVQFGISDSTLILNRLQGEKVIALAAIYQHSPLVLLSLAKNKILSPLELKNKKVMYQIGVDDAIIVSMFNEMGLLKEDYIAVPSTFNNAALLSNEIDAMSAYLGNQTYFYKSKNIPINILKPSNYGLDLYGDMIFTSEDFFIKNQKLALAFRKASLKGWEYALTHTEEMVDLILKKYSTSKSKKALLHEASYTKRMIAANLIELGHLNSNRFSRIEQIYKHWHPHLQEKNLMGLSYREHLEKKQNNFLIMGIGILFFSLIVVLLSLLFAYRSRKISIEAGLKQEIVTNKLDSYQELIFTQLITTKMDSKGIITFASNAFLNALGYKKEDVLGKNLSELCFSEQENGLFLSIKTSIENKGIWRGELFLNSSLGSIQYFDSIVDDIKNKKGEFLSYLTIYFDITDKKEVEKLSITDELTGLYNRHKLNKVLSTNVQLSQKYQTVFSVVLIDVDYFKKINDTYGHNQGDLVLKSLGALLLDSIRVVDVVGRWGGEEFLLICLNSSSEAAQVIAEKVRKAVSLLSFNGIKEPIHISAGITSFIEAEDSVLSLLERADKALYQAKENGRNQTCCL